MEEAFDIEIFEFAIAREVGAYSFYMQLSEQQTDGANADFFRSLADEEWEHKAKLEFELIKGGNIVKDPDEWSQIKEIYPPFDVKGASDISYREALEIAIEKEDMSFRLFADMASKATDEQSKNMLYELAEEELSHKLKCKAQYDALIEWGG